MPLPATAQLPVPMTAPAAPTSTPSSPQCGSCSTGCHRVGSWMSPAAPADTLRAWPNSGINVVGVDQSAEMLEVVRQRMPEARLAVGVMGRLPVRSASTDLTLCSLALEHEPDPEPAIAELARVTRVGGRILISDVHPFAILLDHQAQFEGASGRRLLIRAYPHLHGRLLELFSRNGLLVEQCLEPTMAAGPGLSGRACHRLVGDRVTATAWTGLPIVVIWQLRREAVVNGTECPPSPGDQGRDAADRLSRSIGALEGHTPRTPAG